MKFLAGTGALVLGGGFGLIMLIVLLITGGSNNTAQASDCDISIPGNPIDVPQGPIAGYQGKQLVNAAWILKAGYDLGLNIRDQTIAVMTAMGESSLRLLDHGDEAGPDSRGLFQQRGNGQWGSEEDRMDPYISSTNFYRALAKIQDRHELPPTLAAHQVQRNADPYHYEKYWLPAMAVVTTFGGLSGVTRDGVSCLDDGGGGGGGDVNPEGWARPAEGIVTSPYGWREDPKTGLGAWHNGVDIDGACGDPIWAANDGTVTTVDADGHGGWQIYVDHGGGIVTMYKHMWPSGIHVTPGEQVASGQRIADIGSSGYSTGCHLHFEVTIDGERTDPAAFLAGVGITL